MTKKNLYALLICFSLLLVIVPKVWSNPSNNSCNYNTAAYQGLDLANLTQELNTTGLIGRIHGAAAESQMYLMSVREPDNFFAHREFSLIPQDSPVQETLSQLHRHDLVCVQGDLISNPSPQEHIALSSIKVLKPWTQPEGFAPYERQTDLPEELTAQTSLIGQVHAIGEAGKILVIGYRDGIIPIFVAETASTRGLYRGDIVKLAYKVQSNPNRPIHLQLDNTAKQPIEVLDAIANLHEQRKTLQGSLVKFPQSPQLKFDVYALEVDTQGIKRYFTLINFTNLAEFENIRQKLAQIWEQHAATAVAGRNKLVNPEVKIEATGIANIISPEQANPQILLESAAQVNMLSSS